MPEESEVQASRRRAVIFGGASAATARAVGLVCNLMQVPLALVLLGQEGFGLWVTLQATIAFLAMLDFGLGYRLQNAIAGYAAASAWGEARAGLRTVLKVTLILAGGLALLALAAGGKLWTTVFGVDDPALRAGVTRYLPWLVALGCLSLPANLGLRVASGLQKNWLIGAVQAGVSVLTLGFTAWCATPGTPPIIFLVGTVVLPLVANLALLAALWRRLPREAARPHAAHPRSGIAWIREGLPFFVPQLSATLRANLPSFILASAFGAAAVTPYNLVQRLLNMIAQPQSWLLEPLWPAYTDAASRGDIGWVRRALRLSVWGSIAGCLVPVVSALVWGPLFLRWWTGAATPSIATGLWCWMIVAQAAQALTQPLTICLNGLGRMRGQTIYGPVCAVISLAGMAWAAQHWSVDHVVAPLALAMLLLNLPCAYFDLRRQLGQAAVAAAPLTTGSSR